jgi:hypothetical protein
MGILVPESRDFFLRRLARDLTHSSQRDRIRFVTWIIALMLFVLGGMTISLAG